MWDLTALLGILLHMHVADAFRPLFTPSKLKQMLYRHDQQHNTTMANKACNTLYNTAQVRLTIPMQFIKYSEHEGARGQLVSDHAA